jgi:hypothetical protein
MAFPIPASGLACVAPRLWSLRLFYQQPGGPIGQTVHVDGVWSQAPSTFSAVPLSPLASITWNEGKEIRVYYLDAQYIVQEYGYTEGHGWYHGQTGDLKAKASPLSRLAAIFYHDQDGNHLRVYYQEAKTNVVKELAYDGKWHMGEMQIKDAVEGTGLAAVTYAADGYRQIRVYYQTFEGLYLKEYCHNNKGWFTGGFKPGKAPLRATLGAVATDGHQIIVFWRVDVGIAYSAHTNQWDPIVTLKQVGPGFGFTVLAWEKLKHLRIYYEDFQDFLHELYSDDGGKDWHAGKNLSG